MKKRIFFITVIFTALGCQDNFLDRTPKDGFSGEMVWNTDINAESGVNGVYAFMQQGTLKTFYMHMEVIAPDAFAYVRTWEGLEVAQGFATPRFWVFQNVYQNHYRTIRFANDAIANLEGNEAITPALRDRLLGEVKFIRAFMYFNLINLYGDVVLLTEPKTPSETYLPRTPIGEVRAQIIRDLNDAIAVLPVSYDSKNTGRATKGAAIAMLGKVYLYNERWGEAAAEFEKLMASPYTYDLTKDYFDNFNWEKQSNSETVYELNYINVAGYGSGWDQMYGSRSHQQYCQDFVNPQLRTIQNFTYRDGTEVDWTTMPRLSDYEQYGSEQTYEFGLDLMAWYQKTFPRNKIDDRLHKSFLMPGETFIGKDDNVYKLYYPYSRYLQADPLPNKTTFGDAALLTIRKLVSEGSMNQLTWDDPANTPIIRFADVLLMYAEAVNNVEGPTAAVYNAINRVRNRAKLVDLPPGLSKEEMFREIVRERMRELTVEGILYFDTKRWKLADTDDPLVGLNNDVTLYDGQVYYTGVFNQRDYLWPIPAVEIELNDKMVQNPGWGN